MNSTKLLLPFLFLVFLTGSCHKKKQIEQAQLDDEIIQKYLTENHLSAQKTDSGLYFIIEGEGAGVNPSSTSQVKVSYKGYFTDNAVFDQSSTEGIILGLNQVISGWTEGIPYFKEGGSGKLLIPSALAYGPKGTQGIPGNTVLLFDIHLIDVY
jgi:FKBP-type peptidyl-prolyl cis-trans isomerase FkpA